jgi:hypothetical protein
VGFVHTFWCMRAGAIDVCPSPQGSRQTSGAYPVIALERYPSFFPSSSIVRRRKDVSVKDTLDLKHSPSSGILGRVMTIANTFQSTITRTVHRSTTTSATPSIQTLTSRTFPYRHATPALNLCISVLVHTFPPIFP